MKITRITPRMLEREVPGRLWNPRQRWSKRRIVLVFVETNTGLFGVGEGWTNGGSARTLVATIEDDIAPLLLGQDPHRVGHFGKLVFDTIELSGRSGIVAAAWSALDIALWDLIGKAANTPLYKLLGAHAERVLTYASGGLYGEGKSRDDLATELADYIGRGFAGVKIKVGAHRSPRMWPASRLHARQSGLARD